ISLAVTGVAGPAGGTREKPAGLVYIALASKNKTKCVKRYFPGTRREIKLQASNTALDLLRKKISG
ncbi:MAG: CinA family protein, partial [Candidatus Omnitrophota bacterium]|nr:CinA family protein [Candidatus Omnitrophota bacterium]